MPLTKRGNMKTRDEQIINIIRRVMICSDDQLKKVNDCISLLWEEEKDQEEQFKKDYEKWKADRSAGVAHPYENWKKNL